MLRSLWVWIRAWWIANPFDELLDTSESRPGYTAEHFDRALARIPESNFPQVNDFVELVRRTLAISPLTADPRRDHTAKHLRDSVAGLRQYAERSHLFDLVPAGQWLNPIDEPSHDAVHLARQSIRGYVRNTFAPPGWTPSQPSSRRLRTATPKINYITFGLFLCQLILRQNSRKPFSDTPEVREYD